MPAQVCTCDLPVINRLVLGLPFSTAIFRTLPIDGVLHMLLKAGAPVNLPGNHLVQSNWKSPLYIRAKRHFYNLEILLEEGAKVDYVTKKGRIALHACKRPYDIHILLSEPYNSPLNPKDISGVTPLLMRVDETASRDCVFGKAPPEEGVVMLLQHGASCEELLKGKSFLYHCARHGKLTANICKAAVYSGNEMETVLTDIDGIMSLKQKEEGAHVWLTDFQGKPEPLKMMCVRAIRSQLRNAQPGFSIWSSIFKLPIPKDMMRLLSLNDFQKESGPWDLYSSAHPHIL